MVENIAGRPGSQTPNGPRIDDLNGQGQYGGRLSLRYTPSDLFSLDLVGTYDGQRAPGTAFKSGTFAPTGGTTSPYSFAEVAGSPLSAAVLGGDQPGLTRNVYDVNATARYNPDGPFSFTFVTGYRQFDSNEVFDADGTQAWYLEFAEDARGKQFSAEARVNYDSETFRAFGGVNFFREDGLAARALFDRRRHVSAMRGAADPGPAVHQQRRRGHGGAGDCHPDRRRRIGAAV